MVEIEKIQLTWFGAQKFCASKGMQVAALADRMEEINIARYIASLSMEKSISTRFSKIVH